jgi:hypothetical protein
LNSPVERRENLHESDNSLDILLNQYLMGIVFPLFEQAKDFHVETMIPRALRVFETKGEGTATSTFNPQNNEESEEVK